MHHFIPNRGKYTVLDPNSELKETFILGVPGNAEGMYLAGIKHPPKRELLESTLAKNHSVSSNLKLH